MIRKLFAIPILCISMVFFVQCTDDPFNPDPENSIVKKGPGSGGGGGNGGGGGGGGEVETAGNNLSFPVFAMDAYTITQVPFSTFSVPYTGTNSGLSAEELAALEGYTWYAQKVSGNKWQAEFSQKSQPVDVTFVDWGDVLESVNPKVNRPTRIEIALYKDISDDPMLGYTMALLAYPSSKNETQGTNAVTYDGIWATLVSAKTKLIVQFLANPTAELSWDGTKWIGTGVGAPATGFGFAPELNVGGKYIFGASTGGWKPTVTGVYRITFYIENGSNIQLAAGTIIANYPGNIPLQSLTTLEGDGGAGKPVVRSDLNLSYVDVTVVTGGGGGGGGGGGNNL